MSEPLDKPTGNADAVGGPPTAQPTAPKGGKSGHRPAKKGTDQGNVEPTTKGEVGEGDVTKGSAASPAGAEAKPEEGVKQGGRLAPLTDEEKQTVYSLLHQGKSQRFIRDGYGEGRAESIVKMAEELATGKVVFYEGKWVRAEEREKVDTTKAGETATKASSAAVISVVTAETAKRAVDIEANLMKLGTHVRDTYTGSATQDAQTVEEFLQSAVDFYFLNRGVVEQYQLANDTLSEYVGLLKQEVASLKEQLAQKEVAMSMMVEVMNR